MTNMFEVDVRGLAELEGGKPPFRLAYEPVANVFDECRGYVAGRKRPTVCDVTVVKSQSPRGIRLTVTDDGAGFSNTADIWTLFGTTAKRGDSSVAGRFNAGDKQLIAVATEAVVETNRTRVTFKGGNRTVTKRKLSTDPFVDGTSVTAVMPWSVRELDDVVARLWSIIPPPELAVTVNGESIGHPKERAVVRCNVPTVFLRDGVMAATIRQTDVGVFDPHVVSGPMLHELGIPICSLNDVGFPWSLDVGQKVPMGMARDTVSPAFLFRLIGGVIEAAAVAGVSLLSVDQQGAGFLKAALDWVREPEALKDAVESVYGENAVRQSSDPIANASAVASGATLVSGRWFTGGTRQRLADADAIPVSTARFPGATGLVELPPATEPGACPMCGK